MKPLLKILIISLMNLASLSLLASHIEVKDTISVNTIWSADTVKIMGNLYLAENDSLKIQPGTRVEFQGNFSFISDGIIIAKGAVNDSIVFTINDTTGFHDFSSANGGWKFIQSKNLLQQMRRFKYCIFEYGKNIDGIFPNIDLSAWVHDKPQIEFEFCEVRYCYSKDTVALFIPDLYNCNISSNYTSACASADIYKSKICNNKGNGIELRPTFEHREEVGYTHGRVSSCIIENNTGYAIVGGVKYKSDLPTTTININLNEIRNNSGGILLTRREYVDIVGNIIAYQSHLPAINADNIHVYFYNNLIHHNQIDAAFCNDSIQSPVNITNSSLPIFYYNTICDNYGIKGGGSYFRNVITYKGTYISSNIYWNNHALIEAEEIYFESTLSKLDSINIIANDIKGGQNEVYFNPGLTSVLTWNKNIDSFPAFVDSLNENYALTKNSKCINKGEYLSENSPYTRLNGYITSDLMGNTRHFENINDMGAIEFIPDSVYFPPSWVYNIEFCNKMYNSIYIPSWSTDVIKPDLYIKNFTIADTGIYSFDNYNKYHVAFKSLGKIPSSKIQAISGMDTTIALTNVSDESATFNWFKNGKLLDETKSYIKLKNIDNSDEGYYYCIIDNSCTTTITDSVLLDVMTYCEVYPVIDTVLNLNACNEYEFNGSLRTVSGIYYDTLPNIKGCDSIISLQLTINKPTTSEVSISSCSKYTFLGKTYSQSGTYIDTIPNYKGCDSIITLHLTIPEINTDVEITDEGLKSLQADANYQWVNCDDVHIPVNGAINQTLIPELSGNYAVIVGLDGCSDTSDCVAFSKSDIPNYNQNMDISIFPNPFENMTTIRLGSETEKIKEIRLIDVTGAIVFRAGTINSSEYIINNNQLKAGTYILQVINDSEIIIKQLIHL